MNVIRNVLLVICDLIKLVLVLTPLWMFIGIIYFAPPEAALQSVVLGVLVALNVFVMSRTKL